MKIQRLGPACGLFALLVLLSACGGGLGTKGKSLGGGGGSGDGTLSILADNNTELYVNGVFVGNRTAVVGVPAGSYVVTGVHGTRGEVCWQVNARVDAGKTTRVTQTGRCGFTSAPVP